MTLFTKLYDLIMQPADQLLLKDLRERLVGQADGRVLEVGSGTGLNFPYYVPGLQVTALEPDDGLRNKSLSRMLRADAAIRVVAGEAEMLPFETDSFDTVVCTLVLCTVESQEEAIREIKRVLKPEGTLLLLEHVLPEDRTRKEWFMRAAPAWEKMCGGCRLDRPTGRMLCSHGFRPVVMRTFAKGLFIEMTAKPVTKLSQETRGFTEEIR
ncbi:methyltransferase domain-containing protein [Alkalicoccus luteus]|uniref:Methyltransferase domain-containing protein n=1 Tax=Alkalicoccus luteus TaxID=1237094 RepID=A0A969PZU9_9BACI|nr:methyltransferase domain-containing protein [Alkalicoccus luteus]